MDNIIIKPILTEKMADLGERLNRYAFEVNTSANKIQIKNAVENAYYLRDRFSYLDIMQYLGCIDKYSKNLV